MAKPTKHPELDWDLTIIEDSDVETVKTASVPVPETEYTNKSDVIIVTSDFDTQIISFCSRFDYLIPKISVS